ncbi:DUF427 domain-containing protein [Frankia sp. AgB1.9]|uniref:DUF427 domain-containing protein n=1 Tax=unclassified Frankia TaxID=2632575 RepID=UPI0019312F2E|nr:MULTISPECIES: DUF427 domain-containing protein [unclassified Frankia]MBL7491428.1 DUF427 domain-containing protein [Frankia sp. AgW1.1]MBL7553777.1 DUF427 domain-containing protein [Frankia sp. AgB1.9]MBL7620962.1 DUF427 domain-containing protein [Frankia sp. AgB1.8]
MTQIESAWPKYPDYRIDLVPLGRTARVWFGDVLLAESDRCLVVEETRHVDRLYFPRTSVRWDLFAHADGVYTICPFKGEAEYWDLIAVEPAETNFVWSYSEPFAEVAGIVDHVCFYQERARIEIDEHWSDDPHGRARPVSFPTWGDQAELIRLMDVQPVRENRFAAPPYGEMERNVVEGGQLLGDAIVAATKSVPDQRVVSGYITFSKAASFDRPVDLEVDVPQRGRSFATVNVRITQDGTFRAGALLLMGADAPDLIRGHAPMPDVVGPEEAVPLDMGVTDRDLRIIDGAYDPDPDRLGPPEIYAWCRFRHDPGPQYLHAALLAQSTTHWTIAAAMRPHPGLGEASAHYTLSTGVMSTAIAFHDDFDVRDWHLYANPAIYAGRGLAHGEGRIYARDGRLIASYSCEVMIRPFAKKPAAMGMDYGNVM